MNAHRRTAHRIIASAAGIVAAAGVLAAAGGNDSTSASEAAPRPWNRMEHEAHRSLAEARQEQARLLNPREHEGHRPPLAAGVVPVDRIDPCTARLAQAWEELGHFSDGFETYLLKQAPCANR
jgi:hypothetical protein